VKPVDKKAGCGRTDNVPGRRQAVNDGPKTALSAGSQKIGFGSARRKSEFLAGISHIP
jgi:hypothetical protein